MAKRDVELVIRAKNEATKAIDSVAEALRELAGVQDTVGKSANKTGGLLGELGREFSVLNKQAQGLAAFGKIAGQFDKATAAVARLEKGVAGAEADLTRLNTELENSAASSTRLRKAADESATALQRQKDATAAARQALAQANKEVRAAEAAQTRLAKQIAASKTANADLDAQFKRQAVALDQLRTRQQAATADMARHSAAQKQAAVASREAQAAVKTAGDAEARLRAGVEAAAAAVERQKAALTTARTELQAIGSVADKASRSLGGVAANQAAVSAASKRAAEDIERVSAALERERAASAASAVTAPGAANSLTAFRQQMAAVQAAKTAWQDARAEATKLGQAINTAAQPTREMQTAFLLAKDAARQAKTEYLAQGVALNQLRATAAANVAAHRQAAAAAGAAAAAERDMAAGARDAATAQDRLGRSTRGAAGAMDEAAGRGKGLRGIFSDLYGESRKSMSLFQRLRGEVLSLTTAYIGLYSALRQIGGVISSYRTLEAAQNRLGAVFNQDLGRVGQELEWLNRQAARLGIQFGSLADEYGKFVVAANAANFSSASTRKIFLSVAEAGRVNKLSLEQMSGIFLALTQMISKGKIASEELRRQMGDRLPGAFNIMADAVGVTTAQLDKMMSSGELLANEGTLLRFAEQLDQRFGGQLAPSLQSVTTEIGKFVNELFQAQLRVAQGGFINALRDALKSLNEWFRSREGRDFFLSLGAALGHFVEILAQVPKYFWLIRTAIVAFLALKLISAFGGITAAIRGSITAAGGFATTFTGLAGVMARVRVAAIAMWTAVGGWPGLVLTGIVVAATAWLTSVDKATKALDEHARVTDIIISKYEKAKGNVAEFKKEVQGLPTEEAEKSADGLARAYQGLVDRMRVAARLLKNEIATNLGPSALETGDFAKIEKLLSLIDDLGARKIDVDQFRNALNEFYVSTDNPVIKDLIRDLAELANPETFGSLTAALNKAEAQLRLINGTATDADRVLLGLGEAAAETAAAFDGGADMLAKYTDAIDALKEHIPELARQMKLLKDLAKIDELGMSAMSSATTMGNVMAANAAWQRARGAVLSEAEAQAIKEIAGNTKITADTLNFIKEREGKSLNTYLDAGGKPTIGYGSTTLNGQSVTMGQSITDEQAYQQLVRDVAMFAAQVDTLVKVPITDAMRDALISYAYNTGKLVNSEIIKKINALDFSGAQEALRNGVATVNGQPNAALAQRRADEAALFGSQGLTSPEIEAAITAEILKQLEAETKFGEAHAERVKMLQQELELSRLAEREKAIEQAVILERNEAIKAGVEYTKEMEAETRKAAAATYDATHAEDALKEKKREAMEVMRLIVGLQQEQKALLDQIKASSAEGDSEAVSRFREELESVNARLQEAIQNAMALWAAIGGPEAEAALAKMRAAALAAGQVANNIGTAGQKAVVTGQQINEMIASGLTSAFDKFAQALASGENAIEAFRDAFLQAAADFLREIAQMIIKQLLLNALQGGGGASGGVGGWIAGLITSLFHKGGVVGRDRTPSWVSVIPAFHEGGFPGLKSNEVLSRLEKGEEVLTEDDPRHAFNGGGRMSVKIVNAIDAGDFVSQGLSTVVGEKAFLNFIRANRRAVSSALGT